MKWNKICKIADIAQNSGGCALIKEQQVAIFRVQEEVFAIGNIDPFSGGAVLSRGIIGDRAGVLKVASPLYKQSFCLRTGVCLDDASVRVPSYVARIRNFFIEVLA